MSDNLIVLELGFSFCFGRKEDCVTHYPDSLIGRHYHHLREGGFVIDKSLVIRSDPALIMSSPMCGCKLVGDEVEPSGICEDIALSGEAVESGPFDYVSPSTYAEWWHGKGARVGQRIGNWIRWRDGLTVLITYPGGGNNE